MLKIIGLAIAAVVGYGALNQPASSTTGRVSRVIDGDTIVVDGVGHVRLIGVDTPETHKPNTPVRCYGPQASAYTSQLTGKMVTLTYDAERHDKYGRTLAYVSLGGLDFNGSLIQRGFARSDKFPPNVAHADKYAVLEDSARRQNLGFWGACGYRVSFPGQAWGSTGSPDHASGSQSNSYNSFSSGRYKGYHRYSGYKRSHNSYNSYRQGGYSRYYH